MRVVFSLDFSTSCIYVYIFFRLLSIYYLHFSGKRRTTLAFMSFLSASYVDFVSRSSFWQFYRDTYLIPLLPPAAACLDTNYYVFLYSG